MPLKLETIRQRLLDAAITFGRNESALREERRAEREHRCKAMSRPEPDVGHLGDPPCWQDNRVEREDWCDNCQIVMALRENRKGNRRLRKNAKEQILRLTHLWLNKEAREVP